MDLLDVLKNTFINFMKANSSNKFLENLSEEQKNLSSRIFDLVIGRVLKKTYLSFDEKGKKDMEMVFLSDNDVEKENFIKINIPDFKKIFDEEAKKLEAEIIEETLNKNYGITS